MSKIKYIIVTLSLLCCTYLLEAQKTTLEGNITDRDTGESIKFGNVALYLNGVLKVGVETDLKGFYFFDNLESGIYNIEASYIGYNTTKLKDQVIYSGYTNTIDICISEGGEQLNGLHGLDCGKPLIKQGDSAVGEPVTSDDIKNLPKRNINGLGSTKAVCGSSDSELITDHMTPKEKRKQRRKRARDEKKKTKIDR